MPLKQGKENIGANIKELEKSSTVRPRKQIIAIALHTANVKPKIKPLGDMAKIAYGK